MILSLAGGSCKRIARHPSSDFFATRGILDDINALYPAAGDKKSPRGSRAKWQPILLTFSGERMGRPRFSNTTKPEFRCRAYWT